MKLLTYISLWILFFKVSCKSFHLESVVAQAINQILQHFFAQNSPKIDLIFFGRIEKSVKTVEFLMQNNKDQISFQVVDGNRFGSQQILLNFSSILLFESSEIFMKLFDTITWKVDLNRGHKNHLIYVPGGSETDLNFIKAHFSTNTVTANTSSSAQMEFKKKKVKNKIFSRSP